MIGKKKKEDVRLGRKWERKEEGVKKTPEVIKGLARSRIYIVISIYRLVRKDISSFHP